MKRLFVLLVLVFFAFYFHGNSQDCPYKIQLEKLSNFLPSTLLKTATDIPKKGADISVEVESVLKKDETLKTNWNKIMAMSKLPTDKDNYSALVRIGEEVKTFAQGDDSYKTTFYEAIRNIIGENSPQFPNSNTRSDQKELMAIAYMQYFLNKECVKEKLKADSTPVKGTDPGALFSKEQKAAIISTMGPSLKALSADIFKKKPLIIWLGLLSAFILGSLITAIIALLKSKKRNKKVPLQQQSINNNLQEQELVNILERFVKTKIASGELVSMNGLKSEMNTMISGLKKEMTPPIVKANKTYGSSNSGYTAQAGHQPKQDVIEEFYSIAPLKGSKLFYYSKLEKDFKPKQHIYKITVTNGNTAIYTLVNHQETKKYAFNMPDICIHPAMEIQGNGKDADQIQKIIPGKLKKGSNNNWQIEEKGKIFF